jgi:hypothetical protein
MRSSLTLAVLGLASCASQPPREPSRLPFHVAVVPVEVSARAAPGPQDDDSERADVDLQFESKTLTQALAGALDEGCFTRVSLLTPVPGAAQVDPYAGWLEEARAKGADLILDAKLTYDPAIRTELNGQFWLNLPLFLVGGPFNWLVNDRSYLVDVRVELELYDVATALRSGQSLDASSRVARVERRSDEVRLDFIDRADSAGHWALSLLVPSGLLAQESGSVPEELELTLSEQLAADLRGAIEEHVYDIRSSEVVAFYPEAEDIVSSAGQRFLEGQMVLELGDVSELGELRYRIDSGPLVSAAWGPDELDRSARRPTRRYPFRIPLGDLDSGTVQLEVQQLDRFASTRTFTYLIPPPSAP